MPILSQLACLYRYDLSEFTDWPVPTDGCYAYVDFSDYLVEEGYLPYMIKVNHELAGFVIQACGSKTDQADYEVVEFFILRKFRSRGNRTLCGERTFQALPWAVGG